MPVGFSPIIYFEFTSGFDIGEFIISIISSFHTTLIAKLLNTFVILCELHNIFGAYGLESLSAYPLKRSAFKFVCNCPFLSYLAFQ